MYAISANIYIYIYTYIYAISANTTIRGTVTQEHIYATVFVGQQLIMEGNMSIQVELHPCTTH
jgi:hypothetical protein